MTVTNRQERNRRTTALTCGAMCQVVLASTLLVWSGSPSAADQAAFGSVGSMAVVIATMAVLALAMAAIALSRRPQVTIVALLSLALGAEGVLAPAQLQNDPGIGFLLAFGCLLGIPVGIQLTRPLHVT